MKREPWDISGMLIDDYRKHKKDQAEKKEKEEEDNWSKHGIREDNYTTQQILRDREWEESNDVDDSDYSGYSANAASTYDYAYSDKEIGTMVLYFFIPGIIPFAPIAFIITAVIWDSWPISIMAVILAPLFAAFCGYVEKNGLK